MNIRIICVGKLKEKYWKDAVAEYSKRMTAYGKISFEEIKESPGDDIIEEGRDILARIKKDEYVITLEIKGKPMSSLELAKRIEELGIRRQSRICFVTPRPCLRIYSSDFSWCASRSWRDSWIASPIWGRRRVLTIRSSSVREGQERLILSPSSTIVPRNSSHRETDSRSRGCPKIPG